MAAKQLATGKHIHKVNNYQMIITAKYDSHHFTGYGENAINHFHIISGSFLLPRQPKQEADHYFSAIF